MSGALSLSRGLHSSAGAFASVSKNGRQDKEPGAKLVGRCRAELAARRIKGDRQMAAKATKQPGTYVVPQTHVVPDNEHDAAIEFAAVILPFSRGELARAGKRGKDAAKRWKDGSVLPSAWTMMNLAREIPAVRSYMLAKLGAGPNMQFNSPQGMDALAQAVQALATMRGPEGDKLRAILGGKGTR